VKRPSSESVVVAEGETEEAMARNTTGGTPTSALRHALLRGEALTRTEACDRFGMTGSTFRWVIKSLRDDGVKLRFDVEVGPRNSSVRRWRATTPSKSRRTAMKSRIDGR
jgi:hypothetical protein